LRDLSRNVRVWARVWALSNSGLYTGYPHVDKGKMSIIGRNAAVVELGKFHLAGFIAWLMWLVVHIYYLIGFDNKLVVLIQWAWNYLTFNSSARLILNESSPALVKAQSKKTTADLNLSQPVPQPSKTLVK
jgi:hypothetical protein